MLTGAFTKFDVRKMWVRSLGAETIIAIPIIPTPFRCWLNIEDATRCRRRLRGAVAERCRMRRI